MDILDRYTQDKIYKELYNSMFNEVSKEINKLKLTILTQKVNSLGFDKGFRERRKYERKEKYNFEVNNFKNNNSENIINNLMKKYEDETIYFFNILSLEFNGSSSLQVVFPLNEIIFTEISIHQAIQNNFEILYNWISHKKLQMSNVITFENWAIKLNQTYPSFYLMSHRARPLAFGEVRHRIFHGVEPTRGFLTHYMPHIFV